jgi:thiol-disulfide isomerase/thioredoxin
VQSFTLPALQSPGTLTYDSLKDRPLVINFFASWCPYCVAEMPGFQRVHQALGSKVTFLGVSQTDNSKGASVDLAHRTGITYQTALDAQGSLFRAFGGMGMPVTVFVKPGGQIAEIHTGPLDPPQLSNLIVQYFGPTYAANV